jgi:hypothetical protein
MKFLKFMFTARKSFVLFAFLAFAFTMLYLAWFHRTQARIVIQHPPATQTR